MYKIDKKWLARVRKSKAMERDRLYYILELDYWAMDAQARKCKEVKEQLNILDFVISKELGQKWKEL